MPHSSDTLGNATTECPNQLVPPLFRFAQSCEQALVRQTLQAGYCCNQKKHEGTMNEILFARVMFDSHGNAFGVPLRDIWNEISLARVITSSLVGAACL